MHANVKDVVVNQKHSSGILYDRLLLIRQLWTADQVPKVGTTRKDVWNTTEGLLRFYPKDSTAQAPEYWQLVKGIQEEIDYKMKMRSKVVETSGNKHPDVIWNEIREMRSK